MSDRPNLHAATEALAKALAEGEADAARVRAARLDLALASVEEAWREGEAPWRPASLREPSVGGMAPSPGANRRSETLRLQLEELVGLASCLRLQLRHTLADEAQPRERVVTRLRGEAQELLELLREQEREEDSFVQELATTDIGAGD